MSRGYTRNAVESAKSFLLGRRVAYTQVFNPESQAVKFVLADLAKFCRMFESTYHKDSNLQKHLEGRREVYLRILQHLKLNTDDYFEKYMGVKHDG